MKKITWKIGDLASKTDITVRTLHHYHQTGLLVPSEFTESGHRLYTKSDIARLQQILSLKQLGLSLEEIYNFIEKPNYNPIIVVQTQQEDMFRPVWANDICSKKAAVYKENFTSKHFVLKEKHIRD